MRKTSLLKKLVLDKEILVKPPEEAKQMFEADLIKNAKLVRQSGVKRD
jgi:hypothetical protein